MDSCFCFGKSNRLFLYRANINQSLCYQQWNSPNDIRLGLKEFTWWKLVVGRSALFDQQALGETGVVTTVDDVSAGLGIHDIRVGLRGNYLPHDAGIVHHYLHRS